MALYTRKQLAGICNMDFSSKSDRAKISVAISRGKIIMSGDFIDDQIPQNKLFVESNSFAAKKSHKQEEENQEKPKEKKAAKYSEPIFKEKKTPEYSEPEIGTDFYSLSNTLKERQIEKLEVETRLNLLKEHKILGETMSVELFKQIFATHNQSILTNEKNTIDEILTEMSKEFSLPADKVSTIRGKIVSILNLGQEKTIITTRKTLHALLSESSIKREVGEHD